MNEREPAVLTGHVARLYYEHGMTHQEIANSLGLSRVRVTRLLADARNQGIVEIIVHSDEALFPHEERELVDRFGLTRAWIAPTTQDAERTDQSFCAVGAEALRHCLRPDTLVAVGVSSAIALIAENFSPQNEGGRFAPFTGSSAGLSTGANPHEIALRLAQKTGGQSFHVPAPLVAASESAAEQSLSDPGVQAALGVAADADVLLVGIGAVADGTGILYDSLPQKTKQELRELGAVGDIGARYFDKDGLSVASALDRRVIGVQASTLRAIPQRIGVARGYTKVEAIRAAAGSGLITELVTDICTARNLLGRETKSPQ